MDVLSKLVRKPCVANVGELVRMYSKEMHRQARTMTISRDVELGHTYTQEGALTIS